MTDLAIAVILLLSVAAPAGKYEDMPAPASVIAALAQAKNTAWLQPTHLANAAKCVLGKYGSYVEAYRGFIPASVVATRIYVETGTRNAAGALDPAKCANPNVGPEPTTGETGLLQVWTSRGECGLTVAQAKDPQLNLQCGLGLWQKRTLDLSKSYQSTGLLQTPSGFDFWASAQLNTMIGSGAFKALLKAAGARPGSEYTDVMRYIQTVGEGLAGIKGSFCGTSGCMTPGLVAHRAYVAGMMTEGAMLVDGLSSTGGTLAQGVPAWLLVVAGYLAMRWLS